MAKTTQDVAGPYDLPALRIEQAGVEIFLTSVKSAMLREWRDAEILVLDKFKKGESGAPEGYQRVLDEKRSHRIAQFLAGEGATKRASDIILPLLPQTVLFNVRPDSRAPELSAEGMLRVFSKTRLAQVDGQHRIAGLIEASELNPNLADYSLPVAIVKSLKLSQEAAQFLTINSTQRKVKADLELRVIYHRDKHECQRLATALGFEQWKIKALALTIELNDTVPSPWENGITRPGEKVHRGINEGSFVDSLEPVCSHTRALGRIETSEAFKFLRDFWAIVAEMYPTAWSEDDRKRFALRKTLGVGVFHQVASFAYELCAARGTDSSREKLKSLLRPIFERYKEKDWGRGGRFAQMSGKGPTRSVAGQIVSALMSGLEPDPKYTNAIEKRLAKAIKRERTRFERVQNLLTPLALRSFDEDSIHHVVPGEAGGAYVLVRIGADSSAEPKSIYIGKSEKYLAKRLKNHLKSTRPWDLFSAVQANSEHACTTLEGLLYHLVPKDKLENKNHPPNCPVCDDKWPPRRRK